jgi:hypothetical protein
LSIKLSHDTVSATGTYGTFYNGTVKELLKSAAGNTLSVADSFAVSPLDSFSFKDTVKVPANAAFLYLALYTTTGAFAGYLDSIAVTPAKIVNIPDMFTGKPGIKTIAVTNKGNAVAIQVPYVGHYSIELLNINGKRCAEFSGTQPSEFLISHPRFASGIYFIRVSGNKIQECHSLVLP